MSVLASVIETNVMPQESECLKMRGRILFQDDSVLKLDFGNRGMIEVSKKTIRSCEPVEGTREHIIEILADSKLVFSTHHSSGEIAGIANDSVLAVNAGVVYASDCDEGNACECCQESIAVQYAPTSGPYLGKTVFRVAQPVG